MFKGQLCSSWVCCWFTMWFGQLVSLLQAMFSLLFKTVLTISESTWAIRLLWNSNLRGLEEVFWKCIISNKSFTSASFLNYTLRFMHWLVSQITLWLRNLLWLIMGEMAKSLNAVFCLIKSNWTTDLNYTWKSWSKFITS